VPRFVGAISVVVLLLFVALLYALRPEPVVALGLVFPVLTIVFITSCSVAVTYVAVKAYAREGLLNVLLLGCGALVFACTSLLAAAFFGSEGQNFSATVFATGAALSGLFQLGCASLTYIGSVPRPGRRQASLWLAVASLPVVVVALAAFGGVLPAFYATGSGTTLLDRALLAVAALAFASSSVAIFLVFSTSRSTVLFWYCLALGATAAGLVGVYFSGGQMTALSMRAGWATMYLGGVLLLISVLSAERLALPSAKDARSG